MYRPEWSGGNVFWEVTAYWVRLSISQGCAEPSPWADRTDLSGRKSWLSALKGPFCQPRSKAWELRNLEENPAYFFPGANKSSDFSGCF